MTRAVALSRNARNLITSLMSGEPVEVSPRTLSAAQELARAGFLTPADDAALGFRLSREGTSRRREFLPEGVGPTEKALALLRRHLEGERPELSDDNRPAYRELAAWGLMAACHTFAGGDESAYRLTQQGFEMKGEVLTCAKESA